MCVCVTATQQSYWLWLWRAQTKPCSNLYYLLLHHHHHHHLLLLHLQTPNLFLPMTIMISLLLLLQSFPCLPLPLQSHHTIPALISPSSSSPGSIPFFNPDSLNRSASKTYLACLHKTLLLLCSGPSLMLGPRKRAMSIIMNK